MCNHVLLDISVVITIVGKPL